MKALSITAPHEIAVIDIPPPELKPGWVKLKVSHVGICGTDYHIYEGLHPYLQYPRIIGHELAATVIDGNGTDFEPGDSVIINPYLTCGTCPACLDGKSNCCETLKCLGVHTDGGMTEQIVLPAGNLYPVEGLSPRDLAMVEFLAIGAHGVRRTQLRPGDRVLVVGGGPIGLGAAIFARIAGADVTVLDSDPTKLDTARELGFGAVAPAELDGEDFKAKKRTGFEAVFDATGNVKAMNASLQHVRHGGALTLLGVVKDDLSWAGPEFHRRETTIRGSRNATREDFEHVVDSIRKGLVPMDRLATHETTIDRVAEDLPRWAHDRTGLIKAIVRF